MTCIPEFQLRDSESAVPKDGPRRPCVRVRGASEGFWLGWLGVVLMVGLAYQADADLRAARPVVLVPACLWLLWPGQSATVRRLQNLVFLYLTWSVFAAGIDAFWTIGDPADSGVRVSITFPAVLLIAAGRLLCIRTSGNDHVHQPLPLWAVCAGVVVLAAHGLFLFALLNRIYGFGWEEDAEVAGRLGLFVFLMLCLAPHAASYGFRASLAACLAALLLIGSLQ